MLLCRMAVQYKKAKKLARTLSLSARIAFLSQKRQQTIRPVFDTPRAYVLLSIRDLAKQVRNRSTNHGAHRPRNKMDSHTGNFSTTSTNFRSRSLSPWTRCRPQPTDLPLPCQIKASLDQDFGGLLTSLAKTINARKIASLVQRLYAARQITLAAAKTIRLAAYSR